MYNSQCISVLGSTGSIGTQTLEICEKLNIRVGAIAANSSVKLLEAQARRFNPRLCAVYDERSAAELKTRLADTCIRVVSGMQGLIEAATLPEADTVVTAVVGTIGLRPTLAAIASKKRIALANKETLVCAGSVVMREARNNGAEIIPVDSEHSAIFQCIADSRKMLKHPNWSMGPKVTIDSATMMNKGLEVIEAMHLFGVTPDKIKVLVHRQSIVHSMVEFCDNTVIAQLAAPDMRLPIQYALTYPERTESLCAELDLTEKPLSFAPPDLEAFPCLRLAMETAGRGGTYCAVMNAANEEAVKLFLNGKIGFMDIYEYTAKTVDTVKNTENTALEDIISADNEARKVVLSF